MPEIGFDDAAQLAAFILKDEFQSNPVYLWDEWEHRCSSLCSMPAPWTKEVFLTITNLFRCARNICSLGKHHQEAAKYILLNIASLGIERMLQESDSDIDIKKKCNKYGPAIIIKHDDQ